MNPNAEIKMRVKCMQIAFLLIAMAALCGAAHAQNAQTPQTAQHAQTAQASQAESANFAGWFMAGSFFRNFSTSTSGNGTNQSPTDSYGGMYELSYIRKPLIGIETSYTVNLADQHYTTNLATCGFNCANPPTRATSWEHQVILAWVPSFTRGSFSPFGIAGVGFSMFVPRNTPTNFNTTVDVVRATWAFGGGVNWALRPKMGIRLQVRDNVYRSPNLSLPFNATGADANTLVPSIGVYFRL